MIDCIEAGRNLEAQLLVDAVDDEGPVLCNELPVPHIRRGDESLQVIIQLQRQLLFHMGEDDVELLMQRRRRAVCGELFEIRNQLIPDGFDVRLFLMLVMVPLHVARYGMLQLAGRLLE